MNPSSNSNSAISSKAIRDYDKPWNSSSPKLTYEKLNIKWKSSIPKSWKKILEHPTPTKSNNKLCKPPIIETTFRQKTEVVSKQDRVFQFNFQDGSCNDLTSINIETKKSIYLKERNQSFSSTPIKNSSTPSYAMQYLGVTKGQIGIFTKRLPLPQLSTYETCHNTPLSVIYSAYSPPSSSRKIFNPKVYTTLKLQKNHKNDRSSTDISIREFTEEKNEELIIPQEVPEYISQDQDLRNEDWSELNHYWPDPTQYDQTVIHTYARPRAISQFRLPDSATPSPLNLEHLNPQHSVFKNRFKSYKNRSVETPVKRRGMMGCKISRPKSMLYQQSNGRIVATPAFKKRDEKIEALEKTQDPIGYRYHREPYLKYQPVKNSKYDIFK